MIFTVLNYFKAKDSEYYFSDIQKFFLICFKECVEKTHKC